MDILFTILGALFVSFIISIIILILMQHFNISIDDKNALLIPTIIISIVILCSCGRDNIKNKEIKKIIDTSETVQEIQEKTQKYFNND